MLEIPVPKVTSWSGDDDNSVESAYILMEYAIGENLGDQWQDMDIDDKFTVVADVVAIQKKFSSFSFAKYVQYLCEQLTDRLTESTQTWLLVLCC